MKDCDQDFGHPKVGLSACLAGFKVRYDGQHKRSSLCLNTLNEHFAFQTFCPEVAAGFGTPRPAMRLTGNPINPGLNFSDPKKISAVDLGAKLRSGFNDKIKEFSDLDGYILMKNSPSCGMERVKVYQENGHPHQKSGRGLFANALIEHYPDLPVEEEGRLHDPRLRENFVLRVYVHHSFRHVFEKQTMSTLINFHSRYKYVLMAQGADHYKTLGNIVANHKALDTCEVIQTYRANLTFALATPATRKNHTNTLQHILGYLKRSTSSEARSSINDTIHKYRQGEIPLVVPLTLLKHYLDQYGDSYIRAQRYLRPYPESMSLRNDI